MPDPQHPPRDDEPTQWPGDIPGEPVHREPGKIEPGPISKIPLILLGVALVLMIVMILIVNSDPEWLPELF